MSGGPAQQIPPGGMPLSGPGGNPMMPPPGSPGGPMGNSMAPPGGLVQQPPRSRIDPDQMPNPVSIYIIKSRVMLCFFLLGTGTGVLMNY